jgi:hypothetical protein
LKKKKISSSFSCLLIDFHAMDTAKLLGEVKTEIKRLEKIAKLLGGSGSKGKRKLSAKSRKAIGDAQRKRWAERKKG